MASAPPSLRGGLKIFGKISKGGPGKIPKIRGELNLRGPERFLPKSQLNILKSMMNIDTSTYQCSLIQITYRVLNEGYHFSI